MREQFRLSKQALRRMLEGELDALFTRLQPDLLVCDVTDRERPLPLIAHGHGVPTVLLNTTVPGVAPRERVRRHGGPVGTGLAWLRAGAGELVHRLLAGTGFHPQPSWLLHRLARKYGYPMEEVDFSVRLPHPRTPTLLMCPQEFLETDGQRLPDLYRFLGPCIALDRKAPDFPWERLQEGRPLVLIALGSVPYLLRRQPAFLPVIADAANRRPDWQFVVSVGALKDAAAFERAAPNIIAARQLPQLELLKRATAMVTHCGFNSTKEAIYFGVPMVALPFQSDQPFIARLVKRHGLGVHDSPFTMTGERLASLLDEVITQPGYRQAAQAMSARFREAEAPARMARTLEQLLEEVRRPEARRISA
jgi:MGT family glycosyltransferase